MSDNSHQAPLLLFGRILLAGVFLTAGFSKITNFTGMIAVIDSLGIPFATLALVISILLEFGGALLLILGLWTRWASIGLILFTILTIIFFHTEVGDQLQRTMLLKNLGLIGGLIYTAVCGAGRLSIDERRTRNLT